MPWLFSYGTLQREDVQLATFGRRLAGHPDELPGYEITRIPIARPERAAEVGLTHFPNPRFNGRAESRIPGTALEVTEAELAQADAYERQDAYARIEVTLASGRRAWMYVHAPGTAVR